MPFSGPYDPPHSTSTQVMSIMSKTMPKMPLLLSGTKNREKNTQKGWLGEVQRPGEQLLRTHKDSLARGIQKEFTWIIRNWARRNWRGKMVQMIHGSLQHESGWTPWLRTAPGPQVSPRNSRDHQVPQQLVWGFSNHLSTGAVLGLGCIWDSVLQW